MSQVIKNIVFLYLLFTFRIAVADLPYMPIIFKLSTDKKVYKVGERIQFKLTIINSDPNRSYPIVIPGNQNKGPKLISINAYSINTKTNFYTQVAKEELQLNMQCQNMGYLSVRNLAPHDSVMVYFFLNDTKNYLTKTASHHQLLPNLKEGKYQLLIYYNPKGTDLESLYHYIGTTNDSTSQLKLNFWLGGNVSNYVPVELISNSGKSMGSYKGGCKEDCNLCQHIEARKWKKVKRHLASILRSKEIFTDSTHVSTNLSNHKNVISMSPPPEAILDILPSFYYREIIFNSKGELFFFDLRYQVGKIYKTRARMKYLIRRIWRNYKGFKSEKLDYHELVDMNESIC